MTELTTEIKTRKKTKKRDQKRSLSSSGLDVICPGCKGRFHETNYKFRQKIPARGDMFKLKEPWRTVHRWGSFPETENIIGASLECPDCGTPYTDGLGFVKSVAETLKV